MFVPSVDLEAPAAGVDRQWVDTGTAPSSVFRRFVLPVAGLIVSGLCLWIALRRVSFGDVRTSLEHASWIWLVPTLVATYLTLAVRAVRWRYLFSEPHRVPTWESAKALNIGLMFNNILPSRAGEVPRTFALARRTGLSKVEVATTILVERLLDVLSIAIAGVVTLPWLPHRPWIHGLTLICGALLAGFVIGGVLLWVLWRRARGLAEGLLRRLPYVSAARAASVANSLGRGGRILKEPRRVALALLLSALVWIVSGLAVVCLFPALHLSISAASASLILVATSLAMTVPSTSGALGVYEAAVLSSLVASGVANGPALSFALVLHAVNFVPVSLTGALAAWAMVSRAGRGSDAGSAPAA